MDLAQLKQQLADGKITKEQFAAALKQLLDAGTITQEQHDSEANIDEGAAGGDAGGQGGNNQAFSDEQMAAIQKMMQSEADKVRTKAAKEKKALEDQLDSMKTEKMTEEQKAQHELDKMRKQNETTAAELLKEKVGFHTVKTLTAQSLPIEFDVFLAGDSVENTDERIGAFKKAWDAAIKTAVDAKFKENGDDPLQRRGGAASTKENPFSSATFNLTKQAAILKSDPELAKRLQAEAKI